MARVTVEDCLENVENRFELVMLASKRSRQLATGGKEAKVASENDKPSLPCAKLQKACLPTKSWLKKHCRTSKSRCTRWNQTKPSKQFAQAVDS